MNTMTHAIKTAGIAVPPANKRIWLWLKGHPEKCAKDIAKVLGMKDNNAAALCGDMYRRGMLTAIKLPLRVKAGRGATELMVLHYSVDRKMRGEYELLPLPKKEKPVKEEKVKTVEAVLPPGDKPYDFRPASTGFPMGSNIVLDEDAENALHTTAEKLRDKLGFNVTPSQTVLWLSNNARF